MPGLQSRTGRRHAEERFLDHGVLCYARGDLEKFTGGKVLVIGGGNTTAKSAPVARGTFI